MLVSFLPLWIKFILQPVTSQFSGSVFSAATATSLLLPKFQPIVEFVDTGSHLWPRSVELWIPGPHYCNEDLSIVYTVRIEERRHLNSWDWIGVFRFFTIYLLYVMFEGSISLFFRVSESNLEDHLAYTWASTRLVRDAVYEVFRTPNYGKACFEKLLQAARIYLCKK